MCIFPYTHEFIVPFSNNGYTLGEYSKYPNSIDSTNELPKASDNVTPVKAEVVNRQRDAIIAVESELGVNPSGTYGTVRARLDALEAGSGSGGGFISVEENGTTILPDVSAINFTGNVSVTPSGQPLKIDVEIIGGQASQVQETRIVSNGQTSINLSQTPHTASAVQMYINGLKQQYGTDYSVTDQTVTYSDLPPLVSSDVVEFWYLVDLGGLGGGGGGGGSLTPAKRRVYRTTSNQSGNTAGSSRTVIWNATSTLLTAVSASLIGGGTQLSPTIDGTFDVSGNLTLDVTVDAISGIDIDIVKNGSTTVHTLKDYGAVWGIGNQRSLSFSIKLDLTAGDTIEVRWTHSGSVGSGTELVTGDPSSWFSITKVG